MKIHPILFIVLFIVSSLSNAEDASVTPAVARFVLGPSGMNDGQAIRELAEHPEQWATVRAKTGSILYADHVLNRQFKDDAPLTELFGKFRKINVPLQLEVGAVKPWGTTGADCFNKQKPTWDRFLRCGALIDGIAMDEPLNCCREHLKKDTEFAAAETAAFITLIRQHYPQWTVGDIEGFPSVSADELIQWVDILEAKLKQNGSRGIDFFRVDTDWMHFVQNTGRGSWKDLKRIENHCRSKNIPLSVIYWAADYPAMRKLELADDKTWYVGVMQMGFNYAAVGGKPDQIVIQSWVDAPQQTVPETKPFTFTNSARDLIERFVK
ncbi:MAG: hypothetical protein LBU65_05840 [Planctomycetaceae bacterium]|jgi:hypothetical protein|nr:hypothetical protein [Planctomycetaceae bacterium]